MIKNFKLIFAFSLALCLVLTSCSVGNSHGDEVTEPDSNVIYAPSEDVTDDTNESKDSDSTDDTTDTAPVTEPAPDSNPVESGENTEEIIDKTEDTEPPVSDETDGVIKLGEAFLLGEPVSGRIYSTQNEKIRLVLDYNCQMSSDGIVSAYFEIVLESYDINCGARENGGKFIVNGEANVFSTHALVHEEPEKIFIPFADYTYQFALEETSCEIEASWFFNGVYAGEKLDTLSITAVLDWSSDTVPEA